MVMNTQKAPEHGANTELVNHKCFSYVEKSKGVYATEMLGFFLLSVIFFYFSRMDRKRSEVMER